MNRNDFETRLRRFSRVRRGLINGERGYRYLGLALAAGLAGLLLLSGWLPGVIVNLALFALLALWLVGLLAVWLVKRVRYRSALEEAFRLEELAGDLNSRIVSAWDFLQSDRPTPLERAVITRAAADLERPHETRLPRENRNRALIVFAALLAVFIAVGYLPWFSFARVADNLGRSWLGLQELLFPIELSVELGPKKDAYRLHEKVDVTLKLNRPIAGDARLVQRIGDETKETPLTLEDGRATVTLTSDVEAEQVLTFEVGDRKSEDVTLIFTSPPVLVNMQTELVYPTYTRLPPRSLESVQQRLLALPGTRITLGFTFSKELDSATITWDDGSTLPLEVVGRYATVSLLHSRARQGSLQVRDRHGFALDEPLALELDVQTDEKPQVLLPRHLKEDMPMLKPAAKLFGFGVQASDDYGVTRVVLRWQKSTVENPSGVLERGEVERLISPSQPRAVVNFEKVFADLALKPGDRIGFQVEAQDNRAPQKQTTLSRRCSFFIYQENLGDLTVRELGFGGADPLARERIARSTRATAVKEPEGLRSKEAVRNEFEGNVTTGTQSPTVRGEHAEATRDYFRLLSGVKYPEPEPRKP